MGSVRVEHTSVRVNSLPASHPCGVTCDGVSSLVYLGVYGEDQRRHILGAGQPIDSSQVFDVTDDTTGV